MTDPPRELEYASPVSPREADPRRMFALLLPAGVVVGVFLGSAMFEDGDSRNIGGAMCLLVMVPVALICGISALVEAARPRGFRAFAHGVFWACLLAAGLCGSLWAILRFRLLRV